MPKKRVSEDFILTLRSGRLKPKSLTGRSDHGNMLIKCDCECGNQVTITYSELSQKKRTSCGCILSELDKTGKQFGALTVLERRSRTRFGDYKWLCQCTCGETCEVNGGALHEDRRGCPKCARRAQSDKVGKHGYSKTRLYKVWRHIKDRCHRTYHKQYKDYGARGIFMCREWRESPAAFIEWAKSHPTYREGLNVDRIDNDGPYNPENCRFLKENCNNKRNNRRVEMFGKTYTLSEAVRRFGKAEYSTVLNRLKSGWDIEKALSTPPRNS